MKYLTKKRVAIVYDRVNKWGGAERVLLALHEIFPKAPLYTSVYDKKNAKWAKVFPKVITSFLQKFPFTRANHEFLAPLMPFVFESFDFSDYDLVISVTSEAAKGIKTSGKTVHICYCLTPTRYLWSGYGEYFKRSSLRSVAKPIVFLLRNWDKKVAMRPDVIIGISTEVQKRIKKYYGRSSGLIFPPVEIKKSKRRKREYFLIVSRLVTYKKVDLAIEAFNKLGDSLLIIGSGRDSRKLKSIAGKNIRFKGIVSDKALTNYYKGAKALIMPQEEDFGIVSVEAQSHGVPVIAFAKGGAADTVIHGKTGIRFNSQTVKSLMQAVKKFDKMRFSERILIANAKRFSKEIFKKKFRKQVSDAFG